MAMHMNMNLNIMISANLTLGRVSIERIDEWFIQIVIWFDLVWCHLIFLDLIWLTLVWFDWIWCDVIQFLFLRLPVFSFILLLSLFAFAVFIFLFALFRFLSFLVAYYRLFSFLFISVPFLPLLTFQSSPFVFFSLLLSDVVFFNFIALILSFSSLDLDIFFCCVLFRFSSFCHVLLCFHSCSFPILFSSEIEWCCAVLCYVISCSVLFYSTVFCSIHSCFVLLCSCLFCWVPFCSVGFCSVGFCCAVLCCIPHWECQWSVCSLHMFGSAFHKRTPYPRSRGTGSGDDLRITVGTTRKRRVVGKRKVMQKAISEHSDSWMTTMLQLSSETSKMLEFEILPTHDPTFLSDFQESRQCVSLKCGIGRMEQVKPVFFCLQANIPTSEADHDTLHDFSPLFQVATIP
jgi:hypothetical protein